MKNANFKMNKIAALVAGGLLATASLTPVMAEDAEIDVSVTVNNTINIATTPLNFGTISAIAQNDAAAAEVAGAAILDPELETFVADNTAGNDNGLIIPLSGHAVATVTISDVAPQTALNVTGLTDALTLEHSNPAIGMEFAVTNISTFRTVSDTPFSDTSDATGTLAFNVGGTLETVGTDAASVATTEKLAYSNGTYLGTIDFSVNY